MKLVLELSSKGIAMCVQEHKLYPHAVSALVDGRITWRADGVPVLWTAS